MGKKSLDQCQEVVELVNEYLGHALTAEDRAALEAHLATCPPCTTYLAQMKTVLDTASSLGKASPPADVERQLMTIFQHWCEKKPRH
ncbi:MAG TPA: zf-HC2 domain-containing protein [Polyangiaceae bacterium]|nr:zf-HC2 domain-containing protein [Polyangiaceae bacterium]